MRLRLEKGSLNFELVDKNGTSHGSQQLQTSGVVETELALTITQVTPHIELVPKIHSLKAADLLFNGKNYQQEIDVRAQTIGYDPNVCGALY